MKKPKTKGAGGKKVQALGPWPLGAPPPDEVASQAEFLGSPEHKDYVNPINNEPPHQRSDAFRCEKYPAAQWPEFTAMLRASIRAQCTSAAFDPEQRPSSPRAEAWPRYVWGWFGERMFEARHRTEPPGHFYKAYLLDEDQAPEDPENRLKALRSPPGG
jgi:hypothetical protein